MNLSNMHLLQFEKLLNDYKQKFNQNSFNDSKLIFDTTKTQPLVSVITPTYNSAKFLPPLAKSLNNQSFAQHVQWIIVDDASEDETKEIVHELSKLYRSISIKYMRNKFNGGAAFSLRKGFNQADGEYLAWVSADDYYLDQDKLKKDLELLSQGYDFVFSRFTFFGESPENAKKFETILPESSCKIFVQITVANNINGSSFVVKRKIYEAVGGFDDTLWNVDGDYDMFARLILCGYKIGLSDSTMFNTLHKGQTSTKKNLMLFGTSITRSRFLRIPEIREILIKEILENPLNLYRIAARFPLFLIELLKSDEIQNESLLSLLIKTMNKKLSSLVDSFSEFVDLMYRTEAFNSFIKNFYSERGEK